MSYKKTQSLNTSPEAKAQDKKLFVEYVVKTIENKTGTSLPELKKSYTQKQLYRIGLKHFTTTNKTICTALNIPVEAGTRRKRDFEKQGHLKSSLKKTPCPCTGKKAHFLSTNPDKFDLLK